MTESKPRLAIIEDNQDLREELTFFLEAKGYAVWGVKSAEAFWRELHARPADIVLVDLGLPGEDGFSVIDYLRQLSGVGLIIITARGDSQDRLRGLELGADLYLVKPVNFAKLVGDIEALWERLREKIPVPSAAESLAVVSSADASGGSAQTWTLDAASHRLIDPNGKALDLTPQEYALLEVLQAHPGEVYAKRMLHDVLFGMSPEIDTHRIDVILSRLRQKALQQKIRIPVRTLFGRGLVFVDTRRN
jgi:two-component system, OmpR family, response regulator PhoP